MAIAGLLGVFLQDKARDPNERTRKTDIPEIELVGRSESTDASRDSDVIPLASMWTVDESLERMRESQLPSDAAIQSEERGAGWNG
jgi:hypothetical protein